MEFDEDVSSGRADVRREEQGGSSPLFVTRKFPPSVGGMEILAEHTWASLHQRFPGARLIAHRGGNRWLPLWWLAAIVRAAWTLVLRRADMVLTGDALAYALFRPLFVASGVPHATMIMGLDVTYPRGLYRAVVHPALRRAPRVIAISQATADAAVSVGVDPDRISVIRLGLPAPKVEPSDRSRAAADVRNSLALPPDAIVAVTIGRLVRRKGTLWFVRDVVPHLPSSVVYVVAGDGPMLPQVRAVVEELGLSHRVRLLGSVDNSVRESLLLGADLFVQPNIRVPGDMEGFGLAVLEAAMRGTFTVASGIEGIRDAVIDGTTGMLLPAEDQEAWVARITALVSDIGEVHDRGWRYAAAARASYSVERMGEELARLLRYR